MFQKSSYYRAYGYVFRTAFYASHKAADTAYNKLNLNTLLAGLRQLLYNIYIRERIHFYAYIPFGTVGYFTVYQLHYAGFKAVGSYPKRGAALHRGSHRQIIEHQRSVRTKFLVRSNQGKIGIKLRGALIIVSRSYLCNILYFIANAPCYKKQLGVHL